MIKLDADQAGELSVLCDRIKNTWDTKPHVLFDQAGTVDAAQMYYKLGRVHQKILDNTACAMDLDWLNIRREELEEVEYDG